jgi:hypothetical protein
MSESFDISSNQIANLIFTIRDMQVMLDYDLAKLYNVETKRLNEQVKRNINRFPENFRFQLTQSEWEYKWSQFATTSNQSQTVISSQKHRFTLPFVFTEQGVAMLSAVLHSDTAVSASIQIMNAFVKMRHIILDNSLISHRLDVIETKQGQADQKFEQVFRALENKAQIPAQGIFFEGQVFDAYELTSRIIRTAKTNIILIDNYVDESTIVHLAKKHKKVQAFILTHPLSSQLQLDIQKANEQYGKFVVKHFNKSHDRFLIIDHKEIYHLGASLKDLGKKLFTFNKLDTNSIESLLNEIKELI